MTERKQGHVRVTAIDSLNDALVYVNLSELSDSDYETVAGMAETIRSEKFSGHTTEVHARWPRRDTYYLVEASENENGSGLSKLFSSHASRIPVEVEDLFETINRINGHKPDPDLGRLSPR